MARLVRLTLAGVMIVGAALNLIALVYSVMMMLASLAGTV